MKDILKPIQQCVPLSIFGLITHKMDLERDLPINLSLFVRSYTKNHNTVAVSGHPNPTHSPGVPGRGIETHKGEGYKNVLETHRGDT